MVCVHFTKVEKAQHSPTLLVQISPIHQCWLLVEKGFTQMRRQVVLINYLHFSVERYMLVHVFLNFYSKRTLYHLCLTCVAKKTLEPWTAKGKQQKNLYSSKMLLYFQRQTPRLLHPPAPLLQDTHMTVATRTSCSSFPPHFVGSSCSHCDLWCFPHIQHGLFCCP